MGNRINKLTMLFSGILLLLFSNALLAQTSDDFFNDTTPKSHWTWFDPSGDANYTMTGTNVEITIPNTQSHDLGANMAPRFLQSIPDADFGVEVKFETTLAQQYQMQGIIVQETNNVYIRFGTYSTNSAVNAYVAVYTPGTNTILNQSVGGLNTPSHLRVERSGNDWTFSYSFDGTNFTTATTFTQAFTVNDVGFYAGNHTPNPAYVASADYFRFLSDTGFSDTDTQGLTPPTIDAWYGDAQTFGALGNPQQFVNVLGNVYDINGINSLSYTLNGGTPQSLNIGPDGKRLLSSGDFNIEIDAADLNAGANTVELTAEDTQGAIATKTVTVNYQSGNVWPLPYTVDYGSISDIEDINDVVNVVDGEWELVSDGIRNSVAGYDRLLVVGDRTWSSNLEVEVPITVHSSSSSSGVGFALGWQGHTGSASPKLDWPLEAIGWVRNAHSSPYLEVLTYSSGAHGTQSLPSFAIGTTYRLKIRSEAIDASNSRFQVKIWEDGTTEPGSFNLSADLPTRDGSILMITHRSEVTWGNMTITPLAVNQAPTFTSTPVTAAEEGTAYSYNITADDADTGDNLTITAPTLPSWLALNDNGNGTGTLTGNPTNGEVGLHSVELRVEDNSGSYDTQSFTISVTSAGGSFFTSDAFCVDGAPNGIWSVYDPYDISGGSDPGETSFTVSGGKLVIDVPAGYDHDLWSGSNNNAARILQPVQNNDFEMEAKFGTSPSNRYQLQGFIVQEDNDTYIRFETYHDGSNLRLFAAYINGSTANAKVSTVLASAPSYLKVNRSGNTWTLSYSDDGTNWTDESFTQAMTATQAGLFAGATENNSANSPRFISEVDYFWNKAESFPNCNFVTVTSPNGGETWEAGDTETVTWTSSGVTNIKIEISTDNGSTWSELVASTPAAAGTANVTVPGSASSQSLVRVSEVGNASNYDVSDAVFTVNQTLTDPKITIGDGSTFAGSYVTIPVTFTPTSGFQLDYLVQGKIHFDPNKVKFLYGDYGTTTLLNQNGWTGVFYSAIPGVVDVILSGATPIDQSGTLFELMFQVIDGSSGTADLTGLNAEWPVDVLEYPFVVDNGTVTYSDPPSTSTNRGDATLNFVVDVYDAIQVVYHVVGITNLTGQAFTNADADLDGDVDLDDYLTIIFFVYLHDWDYPFPSVVPSSTVNVASNPDMIDNTYSLPVELMNSEKVKSVEVMFDFDKSEVEFTGVTQGGDGAAYCRAINESDGGVRLVAVNGSDIANGMLGKANFTLAEGSEGAEVKVSYRLNKNEVVDGPILTLGNGTVTSVEGEDAIPNDYVLEQNFPNPFNPSTNITYSLPYRSQVNVIVYDINGRKVSELVDTENSAGRHSVVWNARNQFGSRVSSGVYFYVLKAVSLENEESSIISQKMILLK